MPPDWTDWDKVSFDFTYYVSSSTGNDANDGLTPETAVKSLAMGQILMRRAKIDGVSGSVRLLLKRGDRFAASNDRIALWPVIPAGSPKQVLVSSYGTGARPLVEGTPSATHSTIRGHSPAASSTSSAAISTALFTSKTSFPHNLNTVKHGSAKRRAALQMLTKVDIARSYLWRQS